MTKARGSLVFAMVDFNAEREGVKKCPYSCYMKQKLSDGNRNWEGGETQHTSAVTHCFLSKMACTYIDESTRPGSLIR